jgi:hypothetical protein
VRNGNPNPASGIIVGRARGADDNIGDTHHAQSGEIRDIPESRGQRPAFGTVRLPRRPARKLCPATHKSRSAERLPSESHLGRERMY